MLPFNAQSLYKLRQKYPKALEKIWIAEPDMEDTPGQHEEHIFDFNNGLRLIISRDILKHGDKPRLHMSASWDYDLPQSVEQAKEIIFTAFRLLDRRSGQWQFVGITPKGIPHWIWEEVN